MNNVDKFIHLSQKFKEQTTIFMERLNRITPDMENKINTNLAITTLANEMYMLMTQKLRTCDPVKANEEFLCSNECKGLLINIIPSMETYNRRAEDMNVELEKIIKDFYGRDEKSFRQRQIDDMNKEALKIVLEVKPYPNQGVWRVDSVGEHKVKVYNPRFTSPEAADRAAVRKQAQLRDAYIKMRMDKLIK